MKAKALPFLLMGAGLLSCSSGTKQSEALAQAASPDLSRAVATEATDDPASQPFEVKKFEKKVGENELEIEYPVAGNPELLGAVRTWINEQLGDTYRGSLDDSDALFRHYAAQLGTDPDLNEYGGYSRDDFELEYQNDFVVTYGHTSYLYEGGAHGMGGEYGTTFLRSDGSIFDKACFTSYHPLMPLFIEGLKQYFKVTTDEGLMDCLLGVESLQKLSAPGMQPWIEEDGVTFSYTPYEIAPYSAGAPRFTIPFVKLKPYLTPQGLKFFEL